MVNIKGLCSFLWQLPQNICGILWRELTFNNIIAEVGNGYATSVGARVYLMRAKGGVTLGKYIFVNQKYVEIGSVIKHECGHVLQSNKLGPLYLIIIGIPSFLHAALNDYIGCCKKHKEGYYHFYTEKWAEDTISKYLSNTLQDKK